VWQGSDCTAPPRGVMWQVFDYNEFGEDMTKAFNLSLVEEVITKSNKT
jgi:hypothetical protein